MFEITFISKLSYKNSSANWFYPCRNGPFEHLISYFVIFFITGFLSFSSFSSLNLYCRVPCFYWQSGNFNRNSVMVVSSIMTIDFSFKWGTAERLQQEARGMERSRSTSKALFKLWIMENIGKNQFNCISRCLSNRRGRTGKASNQSITSKWQHEKSMPSKNKCTWETTKKREKT